MCTAQHYKLGVNPSKAARCVDETKVAGKVRFDRSPAWEGGKGDVSSAVACFAVFCTRPSIPYHLPSHDSPSTFFLCLQELRHAREEGDAPPPSSSQLEWERLEQQEWERRNTASSPAPQVVSYSGHDMKKAYYEAFWRARCVLSCSLSPALPVLPHV